MIGKQKIRRFIESQPVLNKLSRGLVAIWFGFSGLLKGSRGSRDHFRSTLSFMTKSPAVGGFPVNITIEPSTYCNLQCPICETGCGDLQRVRENMNLDVFKRIIDQIYPYTNMLIYYFMGEPFFNKDSYAMIRYAKQKGIPFVTTCTNGDIVDPRKLVESGIDEISFQIGGIEQATHGIYRVGSNLEVVINNLMETVRIRNEIGSKMRVSCGFILMKHNEHEAHDFVKLMNELGVDEAQIIDPCVRTVEQAAQFLPLDKSHWIYDSDALKNGQLVHRNRARGGCPWIYYSSVICSNGDVVPCCRDAQGHHVMGNILQQPFAEIWNGSSFRAFRKQLSDDQKSIEMCRLCDGYYPARLM